MRRETGKRVWIVEMWSEIPGKPGKWTPTVGCGLDRAQGRGIRAQWQRRNPEDKFRLIPYWGAP